MTTSLREELGALSEELHQKEDILGHFVRLNKELTAALKAMVTEYEDFGNNPNRQSYRAAKAAIAKSERK